MSTIPMKKSSSSEPTFEAHTVDGKQPDPISRTRLIVFILLVFTIVELVMFRQAMQTELWREFWVSSFQMAITALALYPLLKPRK